MSFRGWTPNISFGSWRAKSQLDPPASSQPDSSFTLSSSQTSKVKTSAAEQEAPSSSASLPPHKAKKPKRHEPNRDEDEHDEPGTQDSLDTTTTTRTPKVPQTHPHESTQVPTSSTSQPEPVNGEQPTKSKSQPKRNRKTTEAPTAQPRETRASKKAKDDLAELDVDSVQVPASRSSAFEVHIRAAPSTSTTTSTGAASSGAVVKDSQPRSAAKSTATATPALAAPEPVLSASQVMERKRVASSAVVKDSQPRAAKKSTVTATPALVAPEPVAINAAGRRRTEKKPMEEEEKPAEKEKSTKKKRVATIVPSRSLLFPSDPSKLPGTGTSAKVKAKRVQQPALPVGEKDEAKGVEQPPSLPDARKTKAKDVQTMPSVPKPLSSIVNAMLETSLPSDDDVDDDVGGFPDDPFATDDDDAGGALDDPFATDDEAIQQRAERRIRTQHAAGLDASPAVKIKKEEQTPPTKLTQIPKPTTAPNEQRPRAATGSLWTAIDKEQLAAPPPHSAESGSGSDADAESESEPDVPSKVRTTSSAERHQAASRRSLKEIEKPAPKGSGKFPKLAPKSRVPPPAVDSASEWAPSDEEAPAPLGAKPHHRAQPASLADSSSDTSSSSSDDDDDDDAVSTTAHARALQAERDRVRTPGFALGQGQGKGKGPENENQVVMKEGQRAQSERRTSNGEPAKPDLDRSAAQPASMLSLARSLGSMSASQPASSVPPARSWGSVSASQPTSSLPPARSTASVLASQPASSLPPARPSASVLASQPTSSLLPARSSMFMSASQPARSSGTWHPIIPAATPSTRLPAASTASVQMPATSTVSPNKPSKATPTSAASASQPTATTPLQRSGATPTTSASQPAATTSSSSQPGTSSRVPASSQPAASTSQPRAGKKRKSFYDTFRESEGGPSKKPRGRNSFMEKFKSEGIKEAGHVDAEFDFGARPGPGSGSGPATSSDRKKEKEKEKGESTVAVAAGPGPATPSGQEKGKEKSRVVVVIDGSEDKVAVVVQDSAAKKKTEQGSAAKKKAETPTAGKAVAARGVSDTTKTTPATINNTGVSKSATKARSTNVTPTANGTGAGGGVKPAPKARSTNVTPKPAGQRNARQEVSGPPSDAGTGNMSGSAYESQFHYIDDDSSDNDSFMSRPPPSVREAQKKAAVANVNGNRAKESRKEPVSSGSTTPAARNAGMSDGAAEDVVMLDDESDSDVHVRQSAASRKRKAGGGGSGQSGRSAKRARHIVVDSSDESFGDSSDDSSDDEPQITHSRPFSLEKGNSGSVGGQTPSATGRVLRNGKRVQPVARSSKAAAESAPSKVGADKPAAKPATKLTVTSTAKVAAVKPATTFTPGAAPFKPAIQAAAFNPAIKLPPRYSTTAKNKDAKKPPTGAAPVGPAVKGDFGILANKEVCAKMKDIMAWKREAELERWTRGGQAPSASSAAALKKSCELRLTKVVPEGLRPEELLRYKRVKELPAGMVPDIPPLPVVSRGESFAEWQRRWLAVYPAALVEAVGRHRKQKQAAAPDPPPTYVVFNDLRQPQCAREGRTHVAAVYDNVAAANEHVMRYFDTFRWWTHGEEGFVPGGESAEGGGGVKKWPQNGTVWELDKDGCLSLRHRDDMSTSDKDDSHWMYDWVMCEKKAPVQSEFAGFTMEEEGSGGEEEKGKAKKAKDGAKAAKARAGKKTKAGKTTK